MGLSYYGKSYFADKIKLLLVRNVFLALWFLGRWYFSAIITDWGFTALISVCSCFICSLWYVLVSLLILFCFQVSWRKTCCYNPYKVVLKNRNSFQARASGEVLSPKVIPIGSHGPSLRAQCTHGKHLTYLALLTFCRFLWKITDVYFTVKDEINW